MRRIWNTFEFVLLFAINGVMLWFFGSYLNFLIAALMILLLLYSLVSVHIAIRYLSVEVVMPTSYVEKNTQFHVRIVLHNHCILPFVRARIMLSAGNTFLGEMSQQEVSIPVRPLGVTETALVLRSEYAGVIEVKASYLTLCDMLSLHPVRREVFASAGLGVLPKPEGDLEYPLNDFSVGMKEVCESRMTGSDFSDVSQVREYIPGDSMKDIHWKLSAKRDELMVKERLRMSSKKIMIVFALNFTDAQNTDAAFGRLYGLGFFYLRNRVPVGICYYSRKFHEVREESVESEGEWRDAILRMLFAQAGPGVEKAFRNLYPEQGYLYFDETGIKEKSG